jgi:hypothetical protein
MGHTVEGFRRTDGGGDETSFLAGGAIYKSRQIATSLP